MTNKVLLVESKNKREMTSSLFESYLSCFCCVRSTATLFVIAEPTQ